jgi:hypothetical protein
MDYKKKKRGFMFSVFNFIISLVLIAGIMAVTLLLISFLGYLGEFF